MPASDFKELALANARRRETQRSDYSSTLAKLQALVKRNYFERVQKSDRADDDCRHRSDGKPTPTHEGARRLQHRHDGESHAGDTFFEKGPPRKRQHCY